VRELARRYGVAPTTVLDWESSESAGTIRVGTLRRALEKMVERPVRTSRPEQRLGLEQHRTIATKLVQEPEHVRLLARAKLPSLYRGVQGGATAWVGRWARLIETQGLGGLIDVMLGTSAADISLRSVSPFAGQLSAEERPEVLRRAIA
jgi:transcriptional regulator with XRE-family HTH domain